MMITHLAAAMLASMAMVQQMDTTFTVEPDGRLDLYNHAGTVHIATWDRGEIRIQARWDEGWNPVSVRGAGSAIRVNVEPTNAGLPYVEFDITTPRGMSVLVQGVELAATIEGVEANVSVQSIEGSIEVTGGQGNVSLQLVEGPVVVRDAAGKIAVNVVDGDVAITDSRGALHVEAVDGSVALTSIASDNVAISTVDGDVSYDGTIEDDGRYFMSTHDGDLDITIPRDANAHVSISTFDGELVSDIPIQVEGDLSQKQFSFTLGSGQALIELSSFDGVIRLTGGE